MTPKPLLVLGKHLLPRSFENRDGGGFRPFESGPWFLGSRQNSKTRMLTLTLTLTLTIAFPI